LVLASFWRGAVLQFPGTRVMFEFDKYDRSLHRDAPATPGPSPFEPLARSELAGMSLLFWGEHCVECAVPACYSTCDLYQARSDLGCRRFAFGTYKNRAFKSIRGYGAEIAFKKWAKLEAFGNTAIYPVRSVLWCERLLATAAPFGNIVGQVVNRTTGSFKWASLTYTAYEKLVHALYRRDANRSRPDAFLLEVYNPAPREVRLQVIFRPSPRYVAQNNGHSVPPVISTVALPPGYSRHEFETRRFERLLRVPFLIMLVPEADSNARLVFLAADLVKFKRQRVPATDGAKIKCVVWDLDNTLWDGILAEGDDVSLRDGVNDTLKALDERGILLSIASKNDFPSAWEKLTKFNIAGYFLYPQIDWAPKSEKIKMIAARLNIGIDSLAFIDDSPFELDEVARAVPEVLCIGADAVASLAADPRLQGTVTAESGQRRQMYREQISRETAHEEFSGDYESFLASCEIVLEIAGYSDADRERVAELVQRTNQLNFSGRKYSRDELERIIRDRSLEKYVLKCSDKYGSYGTVGFCLVRHDGELIRIMDFMLSCRVQGKYIERALFGHLLAHHNPRGAQSLWVNFRPTERNSPARNVLESLGFERDRADTAGACMLLRATERLECAFIEVRCRATT
jgi:FkbH-like protein